MGIEQLVVRRLTGDPADVLELRAGEARDVRAEAEPDEVRARDHVRDQAGLLHGAQEHRDLGGQAGGRRRFEEALSRSYTQKLKGTFSQM